MWKYLALIIAVPFVLILIFLPSFLSNGSNSKLEQISQKVLGQRSSETYVPKIAKENYQAGENIEVSIVGVSEAESKDYKVEVEGGEINARVEEVYENGEAKFDIIPPAGAKPGKYTLKVLDKNGNS